MVAVNILEVITWLVRGISVVGTQDSSSFCALKLAFSGENSIMWNGHRPLSSAVCTTTPAH